ncbi:MAG: MBL fold metallo-hydrolase [Xanthobacteraceae bacterium]|nr:MBL fold metallo-hydrolase [Xanthobacteraceae bacterium]
MWEKTSPPLNDQIEVSVIGPGFGEAIVVHFGSGRWVTFDSCVDQDGNCASLSYLRAIGVQPEQVQFTIATHWHQDHIRGLPQLVAWASKAQFWCPTAFGHEDFLRFASAYSEADISMLGAPTSELAQVFEILGERGSKPRFAHQDTIIYADDTATLQIFALSPVQSRIQQFLKHVASLIPELRQSRIRVGALHPNLVSLAVRLVFESDAVILGADLQEHPHAGWTEILDACQCLRGPKATLFKIPHHGSENAHLDRQWSELLVAQPASVLTPYNRGSRKLPTDEDIRRIMQYSTQAYSTARMTSVAPRRLDRSVERSLQEGNIKLRSSEIKMGHVQFRKKLSSPGSIWHTTLFGNAIQLR